MEHIRKEEESVLKEYHRAVKEKAEQENRMHEITHAEIQEKRLRGIFCCLNIDHEMGCV
jgi:hypothetical protein